MYRYNNYSKKKAKKRDSEAFDLKTKNMQRKKTNITYFINYNINYIWTVQNLYKSINIKIQIIKIFRN